MADVEKDSKVIDPTPSLLDQEYNDETLSKKQAEQVTVRKPR